MTSSGTTLLRHAGLAIPIGLAVYDLCSKCNIRPQFQPQNGLIMQLCIAYVLLVDPKVSHAKNEPDLWRTESARGAQTYIHTQTALYIEIDYCFHRVQAELIICCSNPGPDDETTSLRETIIALDFAQRLWMQQLCHPVSATWGTVESWCSQTFFGELANHLNCLSPTLVPLGIG